MNDIKLYSYQLRPHSIDQLGITPTLGTLVDSVQKVHPDITISLETNFEERCHPSVEINIYRVVQEALHNITKYAKASKVVIRLEKKATNLTLHIEDDGVGFNLQQVKKEGLGLKHMEERITLLGGFLILLQLTIKVHKLVSKYLIGRMTLDDSCFSSR